MSVINMYEYIILNECTDDTLSPCGLIGYLLYVMLTVHRNCHSIEVFFECLNKDQIIVEALSTVDILASFRELACFQWTEKN